MLFKLWKYISGVAVRFATFVWNSLTFVINLIPAVFVLLSISYKLLSFKNIFAFARAGFGSYSELKELAQAVLEENKTAGQAAAARHAESVGEGGRAFFHDRVVDFHEEKEASFEELRNNGGFDAKAFAKTHFASIVRAMGLLKGTSYFHRDERAKFGEFMGLVGLHILAHRDAELQAKLYVACEDFAKPLFADPKRIFEALLRNPRGYDGYGEQAESADEFAARIRAMLESEANLVNSIPRHVLGQVLHNYSERTASFARLEAIRSGSVPAAPVAPQPVIHFAPHVHVAPERDVAFPPHARGGYVGESAMHHHGGYPVGGFVGQSVSGGDAVGVTADHGGWGVGVAAGHNWQHGGDGGTADFGQPVPPHLPQRRDISPVRSGRRSHS